MCGVCNEDVSGASGVITCVGDCGKSFHLNCVKDYVDEKKLRSAKQWKCKECRTVLSTSSGVSTALTKDFLLRVMESFKQDVFKELQTFKSEMSEMTTSMSFLSEKVDQSNSLMNELKKELSALKKENEALRAQNANLDSTVCELQDRVRSLEQYSRRTNIEVSGVPVTRQEDVMTIVKDLGAALGLQVEDSTVTAAHRVPTYRQDRTPSLVVQFSSKIVKDTWIGKFKDMKGTLTADKVNSNFKQSKVYVNEHLSPDNKLFLAKLKKRCQEIGYTYVWCREGKFFVRKSNGEKCYRVNSLSEMNALK